MSRKGKKKILFILEIVILLLFIGGLFVYGQISSRLDKLEQPVLDQEKIIVNPEVQQAQQSSLTGYTTYALFGIDRRTKNENYTGENSDTIIIASVNNDTKEVKLVSVYRDTLLNVGNDTYSKANAAYAYGGAEQAISMLNTNLDLNIQDYATIDFNALTAAVDALGGLDIELSYAEIVHMNNYCIETSKETGKSYTPVELPVPEPEDLEAVVGTYHLNGVQATSYCRIRYTASMDMGRTERQRRVLQMLTDKAKQAGLTTLFSLMDEIFPMVTTSLSKNEILQLLPTLIGYSMGETTGFPSNYKFADIANGGSIIAPTSLASNVEELHRFLYGADVAYTPSSAVTAYSNRVDEIVANGGEGASITEIPENPAEEWTETYTDYSSDNYNSDYNDYNNDYNDYNSGDYSGSDYNGGGDYGGDYNGGDDYGGDYNGGDDYGGDYSGDNYGGDYSGGDYGDGTDYSGDDASFEEGTPEY